MVDHADHTHHNATHIECLLCFGAIAVGFAMAAIGCQWLLHLLP
jgi:hypothetical protein